MSEQCFLRREAYQATKNAQSVVWENEKLPAACRDCARTALQKSDIQLALEEKGVKLNAEGEPDCHWGMISKEGKGRLLVLDVPIETGSKEIFNRTYPRIICSYESGSILRQLNDLPPNQYL